MDVGAGRLVAWAVGAASGGGSGGNMAVGVRTIRMNRAIRKAALTRVYSAVVDLPRTLQYEYKQPEHIGEASHVIM